MNKSILIAFAIITGLVFSSCKNTKTENKTKSETTIPVGTKDDDYAKRSVDDKLADKIKEYINDKFLTEADNRAITEGQRKFQLYKVDLNNNGNEEVFVKFATSYFCGTGGCTVLLLDNNMDLITKLSPTQDLYVENAVENGYKVLLTYTEGEWRKLVYEKGSYPTNPTMVEATSDEPSEQAEKMFDVESGKLNTYSF